MKKLNRKLIKGTNWALAGLMSFLGFSSCEKDIMPEYGTPMEYGTPSAVFVVSGKVTDTTGNALNGIRVVVPSVDHHQKSTSTFIPDKPVITNYVHDTLYTNADGNFNYPYTGFPSNSSIDIKMKFEDISENPSFETDSTKVTFSGSDLQGGNGWNAGTAQKEITIELKNKENE